MNGHVRVAILALLVAMVGRPASQAHGENFFKRKARGAVKAVSEVFAPGVSTLVDAASTPILHNVEGTGRRLLYDFEGVAARRMDQAGTLVNKAVDNAFDETGKLVSKVDASLEARILQVTTSANSIVDNIGAEARATIRTADQMIANNIARVRKAAIAVLDRVDLIAAQRLAQIDEILRLRLGDVGQLIQGTLAQVDEIAKARLDQADEIAGRRIGNVDVIATKQGLSLEAMLVRLATLLGAFFFFAFLMWSAWNNFVKHSDTIDQLRADGTAAAKQTMLRKLGLWTLQTAFAVACFIAVVVVAGYLPKDAQKRSSAQVAEHAQALINSVNSYDFTAVRYHHSQLEILRPGDPTFRGLAIKAVLLRDLFERPARLHTAEGLRDIERQLDAARDLIPHDPDLLVIEGYVIWRVGATRDDELDAADLCAQALALRPRGDWTVRFLPGRFLLRALGENYVRQFRHDPFSAEPGTEAAEKLARVTAAKIPPASHLRELEQVFAYNELVARLDEDLTPAYLEMLEAHVQYAQAATAKPYVSSVATATRKARSDAAQKVVTAWLDFDNALAESDALAGDPAALNAFTLDDAVLSQALFFYAEAHDDRGQEIPLDTKVAPPVRLPLFFDGYAPPAKKGPGAPAATVAAKAAEEQQQLRLRVAAAPMRIRWAKRMEPLLGKTTQDVLAKEEAQRFRALEKRLHDMTTAYVEVRKAADGKIAVTTDDARKKLAANAETAARAAADMGLWRLDDPATPIGQRLRKPFAPTILDAAAKAGATVDAKAASAIADAQRKRRLRFL